MNQNLTIYFTSDMHGYFFPTNYASREEQCRGLLKCAQGFAKDGNTLVLDAGDLLQGSAYTYYCQSELHSNESIAKIMNQCGYDAVTFGNHDFNYGTEYLSQYLDVLEATAVCQNVMDLDGNARYPYLVKTMENGLKVGIVGIVTDYVNIWEKPSNIKEIMIVDPFEEAKKALASLKGNVDITICLYHGGFERDLVTGKVLSETTENVAYRICQELDFDILLTGHQHMSIEGQNVHGTFVVQPKENAVEYHKITVSKTEVGIEIASVLKRPEESARVAISEEIAAIEADVQDWLDSVVGELTKPLLPEDKLTMARKGNAIADFLNRIQLHYSGAMVSAVSLANEIAGFNASVTRRDIIATYPYPNTLVVYRMTGKQLRLAVERSAEYFAMDDQGNLAIAKDFLEPKVEHYNYDFYAGIHYRIDPSLPCGERVTEFSYEGKDIQNEDLFTVCVNNYRASGAGNYPMYPQCEAVKEINVEMVELIMGYFEEQKGQKIDVGTPTPILK